MEKIPSAARLSSSLGDPWLSVPASRQVWLCRKITSSRFDYIRVLCPVKSPTVKLFGPSCKSSQIEIGEGKGPATLLLAIPGQ